MCHIEGHGSIGLIYGNDVEQRIRRLPLPEDAMVHSKFCYSLFAKYAIRQNFPIARLLLGGRHNNLHLRPMCCEATPRHHPPSGSTTHCWNS